MSLDGISSDALAADSDESESPPSALHSTKLTMQEIIVNKDSVTIPRETLERWKAFYFDTASSREQEMLRYLYLGKADVCVELLQEIEGYNDEDAQPEGNGRDTDDRPLGSDPEERRKNVERLESLICHSLRINYLRHVDRVIIALEAGRRIPLASADIVARLFVPTKAKDVIVKAIADGEIDGGDMETKEVKIDRWGETFTRHSYNIEVRSLLQWLTSHYSCLLRDEMLGQLINYALKESE